MEATSAKASVSTAVYIMMIHCRQMTASLLFLSKLLMNVTAAREKVFLCENVLKILAQGKKIQQLSGQSGGVLINGRICWTILLHMVRAKVGADPRV